MGGGGGESSRKASSNVMSPNWSWKNTADSPTAATDRAMAAAIGTPATPHRVESDASATASTVAVLSCSNSRMIIGLKLFIDDCAQSIDAMRSPACQSRTPTELDP